MFRGSRHLPRGLCRWDGERDGRRLKGLVYLAHLHHGPRPLTRTRIPFYSGSIRAEAIRRLRDSRDSWVGG